MSLPSILKLFFPVDINECAEVKDKPVCGLNANCRNLPSSYECHCPPGFTGNPYVSCWELGRSIIVAIIFFFWRMDGMLYAFKFLHFCIH